MEQISAAQNLADYGLSDQPSFIYGPLPNGT